MKEIAMKITASQLRRFINEEVSRVMREIVVDPEGIDRDYTGLGAPPCDHCGSDNTTPEESTPSMMGYGDDQSWTCEDCGGVTYSTPLGRHSMR